MCGIAGILVHTSGPAVDLSKLERLRDTQRHRGPDDAGHWISPSGRIGLAHRRLSIIDLSPRGHQPMSTPDGILTITFNGEIYNYRELRQELEELGERFSSDSDTEVILLGYRRWGADVVNRLRGMFAFGIWDEAERSLFLARDHLGIKPLYWVESGAQLVFASEVRALQAVVDLGGIDPRGLTDYLLWGSISSPATLFSRAHSLEPGQWMKVRESMDRKVATYWRLEEAFGAPRAMDVEEARRRVQSAIRDSVRRHMIADVPVGAFLSGGVDSATLVGLLTELQGGPIETVTLGGDDPSIDERELAALVARHYGTRHHEIHLGSVEMRDRISKAVAALDLPTIDGINSYLVSEAAHLAGLKVAVTGVGADELFGGYGTFRIVPRIARAVRCLKRVPGALGATKAVVDGIPAGGWSRALARGRRYLEYGSTITGAYSANRGLFSPDEIRRLIAPEFLDPEALTNPSRWLSERVSMDRIPTSGHVSALEIKQYLQGQLLRDVDAVSMAHSLEVRTPFVDCDLWMEVLSAPAAVRMATPAKLTLRTTPRRDIPTQVWARKKQGFSIPIDRWLRENVLDLPMPTHPMFDRRALAAVEKLYRTGGMHWSRPWALMVLGQFLRN